MVEERRRRKDRKKREVNCGNDGGRKVRKESSEGRKKLGYGG